MFDDFSRFDDLYGRDRDGRESGGEEREETIEKIKYKVTVTVYIYTVIVASLDIYKPLQALMHVYFLLYWVNFCIFFFFFLYFTPMDAIALFFKISHII